MARPVLSETELEEAIKALLLARKCRHAAQLALELAAERRQRQQAFYQKLLTYAREQGVEWELLTPAERIQFVLQHREGLSTLDDFFTRYEECAESLLREAAAQRGLNWDTMSDEERTEFVAEWLEDK